MTDCHQFHPAVQSWFQDRFDQATEAQVRGWPAIQSGAHTLIAAPTGSGKTLAAFLASLDQLFKQAVRGELEAQTKVLYVSPLKALSNDIHKNLAEPLAGIREQMRKLGFGAPNITTAVRTGDTSQAQRQTIVKHPPHILVTTPESFYLLLTSDSGRGLLKTVETLIVDEIHALAGNRRGAHLALSMERLDYLVEADLQRIGLSATQSPMEKVAYFLVGDGDPRTQGSPNCTIVDEGHLRELDLDLEVPQSPLQAVMENEVWEENYHRLIDLIEAHKTTLIFCNTRRLAERVTYHLASKLGEELVTSHHGSLSLQIRHRAEERLKQGKLKAMVATASLELGIDIGYVDLVCQLGSPRAISTFLQRVGRSGHCYGGKPKGRLFPLTRDELVECAALVHSVRNGQLDRLILQEKPLDVLSQQLVAEVACGEWEVEKLFQVFRRAWMYRNLERDEFDEIVAMLADGFSTKRGRRGAYLYHDAINGRIKARKGARLAALTNGGAIPDNADYSVVLEPQGTFIGSLNEDFAVESLPGDIFQLGNNSWRILKIETGKVRVEDAAGLPPTIPFWFGEAPGRTAELSKAVSDLRNAVNIRLEDAAGLEAFLTVEMGLSQVCAQQLAAYLGASKRVLGLLPTQEDLVMERFFDEAGGMQLVIHGPFGSRINRAWGLALRKRFCRSFNFELQAAANEDAIVLSLGPKHSFPLEDVYSFLNLKTVRQVLIQALLDAPVFQTRWRWNASRALALLRQRGGRRVPPPVQRMQAEDLIAVVFPDQLACLENISGEREIPDHPLVNQTIQDCLHEAMDLDGLEELLKRIQSKTVRCHSVDLPEPSPLCHEILNAKPYAFLDDAPLEERRTQAVFLRRTLDHSEVQADGLLDQDAIEKVVAQAKPETESPDQLHEALYQLAGMDEDEIPQLGLLVSQFLQQLMEEKRACVLHRHSHEASRTLIIAVERLPQWQALFPRAETDPGVVVPTKLLQREWDADSALISLLRSRLEVCGPTSASHLSAVLGLPLVGVERALLALEAEGVVMRGRFSDQFREDQQWCDRRLLARIHRLTINRLRKRIKPVSTRDFMRFLFYWQRVDSENRAEDTEGLVSVVEALEGFEAGAGAWEPDLLTLRMKRYRSAWLDQLCLMGRVGWARITPASGKGSASGPIRTSPISLFFRENAHVWCGPRSESGKLSSYGAAILELLAERGALFPNQIEESSGLLATHVEMGLGELVSRGLVHSDAFAGLRGLLLPANKKPPVSSKSRRRSGLAFSQVSMSGRWSLVHGQNGQTNSDSSDNEVLEDPLAYQALVLLRRYGVVFRRLLAREAHPPPWWKLLRIYRRMEAVGEIRGGHFVSGYGGEHFALPEAIGLLRSQANRDLDDNLYNLSACDPLNLTGSVLPGTVIPQMVSNRILFRNGLPIAAIVGGNFVILDQSATQEASTLEQALTVGYHNDKSRQSLSNYRNYSSAGFIS